MDGKKTEYKIHEKIRLCCLRASKRGREKRSLMQKQTKGYSSVMDIMIHIGFIFRRETRSNVLAT